MLKHQSVMIPGNEDGSSWSLPASVNSADSGIPGTGTIRRRISPEQLGVIKNTIRQTSLAGMSEISETEVSRKKNPAKLSSFDLTKFSRIHNFFIFSVFA